jgi:hypothetical protein
MTTAKSHGREALREAHPDAWIAVEPGETLEGEIVDVTDAWSDVRQGGSLYPLITVRTDDGVELKVHCFGAVLYNEIMRYRPEIGERIEIRYLGQGKAKQRGMNPPELYRVRVPGRGRQAASTYDRIEGNARSEAEAEPDSDIPADASELPF